MTRQLMLNGGAAARSRSEDDAFISLSVRVPGEVLNYLDGLGGAKSRSSAVRTILEAVFKAHADECVIQDLIDSIVDPGARRHGHREMFR